MLARVRRPWRYWRAGCIVDALSPRQAGRDRGPRRRAPTLGIGTEAIERLENGIDLMARANLLVAGYHRHDRGEWRCRRNGNRPSPCRCDRHHRECLQELVRGAEDGDVSILPELRNLLDAKSWIWPHYAELRPGMSSLARHDRRVEFGTTGIGGTEAGGNENGVGRDRLKDDVESAVASLTELAEAAATNSELGLLVAKALARGR